LIYNQGTRPCAAAYGKGFNPQNVKIRRRDMVGVDKKAYAGKKGSRSDFYIYTANGKRIKTRSRF
jgi:hypothetical protein|tara:strand:- start:1451 stop:1645 length:195 start_codon:yes stop_codon:yes gene_type:complete